MVDMAISLGYGDSMRIVILGAGFGGLELATRLSEEIGNTAEIVLIDYTGGNLPGDDLGE